MVVPLNAIGSNYDFETGDWSTWNVDGTGQQLITSPGYNSEYAAYLAGDDGPDDTQAGFDMTVAVVPGLTYTYSFAYFIETSSNSIDLQSSVYGLEGEDQPVNFEVFYGSSQSTDTNGNAPGFWYTISFVPFVAVSEHYDVSIWLTADDPNNGIRVDNFQLLASAPGSDTVATGPVTTTVTVT